MCTLCSAVCPASAIAILSSHLSASTRAVSTYSLCLNRCIMCGFCDGACPVHAMPERLSATSRSFHTHKRANQTGTANREPRTYAQKKYTSVPPPTHYRGPRRFATRRLGIHPKPALRGVTAYVPETRCILINLYGLFWAVPEGSRTTI